MRKFNSAPLAISLAALFSTLLSMLVSSPLLAAPTASIVAITFASEQATPPIDFSSRLIAVLKQDDVLSLEKLLFETSFPLSGRDGLVPLILAAQHNALKSLDWLIKQGVNL